MQNTEQLIAVYADGKSYSFRRGGPHAESVYGGPLSQTVTGCAFGPARLHHVASLSASSLPLLQAPGRVVFNLPLVYGFRFEDCLLDYRFDVGEVEVLRILPDESSEDWPYLDYPALLPYIPIEAEPPIEQDWTEFALQFSMFSEKPPAELVAVVPPAFLTGPSLWGPHGEGVSVVFECDLSRKIVRTYNVCS